MKLVPYVLIGSLAAIACSGQESGSSSNPDGGGGMGGEGGELGGAPPEDEDEDSTKSSTVQFLTEASVDVPGYPSTVRVVGELEGDATYAWELVSAPKGSSVEQDDLQGASEPEVSFVPDLGGKYVLEVTVTLDGASATKTLTITPPTYDIPFLFVTTDDDNGTRRVPRIVKSGGEDVRDIGCGDSNPEVLPDDGESSPYVTLEGFLFARAFFPAAVHGTARLAYHTLYEDESEDPKMKLVLASSATSCEGEQPAEFGESWSTSFLTTPPEFSRTGTRLATVTWDDGSELGYLQTFGADGSSPHLIKTILPLTLPFSMWLGADRIAWFDVNEEQDAVVLLTTRDADGAGSEAEVLLECKGDTALPDAYGAQIVGDVLYIRDSDGGLWHMERGSDDVYDCDFDAPSNTLLVPDKVIREFEVDPLGEFVAFSAEESDGIQSIHVMPADGSANPIRISPKDDADHRSPHWTLGGRQLIWTSIAYEEVPRSDQEGAPNPVTYLQPSAARLYRANRDGSRVTVILEHQTPGRPTARIHVGPICTFAPWQASWGSPLALLLAGCAGAWVSRRRSARLRMN